MNIDDLYEIIKISKSITEAIKKLWGYHNQNVRNKFNEFVNNNNIDISHLLLKKKELKRCLNCGKEIEKNSHNKKFCNQSCAASFNNKNRIISEKTKERISKTITKKLNDGYKIGFAQKTRQLKEVECNVCGNKYITYELNGVRKKLTCSKECRIKLATQTYKNNKTKKVGGCRKGSGRGKSGWYNGYWCDSSYELAFVIYNIDHNILFERNTKGFSYKWKNKSYLYYPDFIINETFIEIKGHETEKDIAKYQSINRLLIVYKKKDLSEIFQYVIKTYGFDYIKLYENNPYKKLTNICKVCGKPCISKNIYCSRSCAGKGNNKHSTWKQ